MIKVIQLKNGTYKNQYGDTVDSEGNLTGKFCKNEKIHFIKRNQQNIRAFND